MLDHHHPSPDDDFEGPGSQSWSASWSMSYSMPADLAASIADLRRLARDGELADAVGAADCRELRRLTGAAMAVAWPIVFGRLTRPQEMRRGHHRCASGLTRLGDPCLDRFYDDLEAVVADLLRARARIENLEGWLTSRLRAVTVDAHRRRRGARGSLQRPRLPRWLQERLDEDPWLTHLALEILIWVGVPTTAGTSIWPLDSWSERRAAITGDALGSTAATVAHEVEKVLATMRTKPTWYESHVERPLGMKTPPVAPALVDRGSLVAEPPALALTQPHELDDAVLREAAAVAFERILAAVEADPGLDLDHDLDAVVAPIIVETFGVIDVGADLADLPHSPASASERIPGLVADPASLARITTVIRDHVRAVLRCSGQA